jgi:hypothetical protein
MRYLPVINSEKQHPDYSECGNTIIVTFDHTAITDDEGNPQCQCSGYEMTMAEYISLQNGSLPVGVQWNDALHRIFREHQHMRADNEYVYANRMLRMTSDPKWQSYIIALDLWNASVSALASTCSTVVPELPTVH